MAIDPLKAKLILEKRRQQSDPIRAQSLFALNFPQQLAFVNDPAKLKALFCTRRAAKSYTAGLYLVYEALTNPGCNCLFVGLTRASAKGIIWKDILRVINRKHKLKCTFNLAELTVTFPNGSVISILGVDADEDEMNKLLGRKYRLVCIDEASMYTIDLGKLVYGILKPAMTDPNAGGQRGTICLMGTSSNFTRGLFYDLTTGKEKGWSLHQWTAHDNPFIAKQWQEELDEIDTLRPLYKLTPQYRQWYLNEWVIETEKLVYKYDQDKNSYDKLPQGLNPNGWTYTLGVDTGWTDDNAFVLSGYHENDPTLYIIKTFNKPHMTFDQVIVKINEFMSDSSMQPSKVIIDGANKQGVESMKQRSAIPFEYADKNGKPDFIEMMNADLIQGKVRLQKDLVALRDEMMGLVWKTEGDKICFPRKEHPSLPNHLCDALLYNWRMSYHFHFEPLAKKIAVGTKEWFEKECQDIWEKEADKIRTEQNGDGWPSSSGTV